MRMQLGSMTNTNHFTKEFWEALGKAPPAQPVARSNVLDVTLAQLGAVSRVAQCRWWNCLPLTGHAHVVVFCTGRPWWTTTHHRVPTRRTAVKATGLIANGGGRVVSPARHLRRARAAAVLVATARDDPMRLNSKSTSRPPVVPRAALPPTTPAGAVPLLAPALGQALAALLPTAAGRKAEPRTRGSVHASSSGHDPKRSPGHPTTNPELRWLPCPAAWKRWGTRLAGPS